MVKFTSIALKIIGLLIIGLAIVHAFVYQFPSAGLGKPLEVLIAFGLGVYLLIATPGKIESKIDKGIDSKLK